MLQVPALEDVAARPLRTARCSLAPLGPGDARPLHDALASGSKALEPWLSILPLLRTPAECERYAAEGALWWGLGAGLRFAVRSAQSGRLLGLVSLDSLSHTALSAQVGVFLVDAAQGQGLGAEAVGAVVRFAFDVLGAHRLGAATCTDNAASIAFFLRLGFQREGTARDAEFLRGRWVDHALFSLLSTEAEHVR